MVEKFACKGSWRLPDSATWLNGELKFSPDSGIALELYGTFSKNVFDQSDHNIILGRTTEGDITLFKSYYKTTKRVYGQISIGVYKPTIILIGKHFNTVEEITFREVSFTLFNLFEWCGISGFKTNFNDVPQEYSIGYLKPDDIEFPYHKDCDGRISFFNPIQMEDQNNRIELEEHCSVLFKYKEKENFDKILTDMTVFQKFITLSTFEQSYPLSITFRDDDYFIEDQKVRQKLNIICIYQNTYYNKNYKIRRSFETLLKLQEIQNDFPKLIWNWYEKYHEIEPAFILLLDYFIDKTRFDTEKFMDIVRGLETFHRNTSQEQRLPKPEFSKKIKKILETVDLSKSEKEWLKNELQYSNELKLKERLNELIYKYSNKYIQNQIVDISTFCKDVVNTRNYYTHYGAHLKKKSLTGNDLFKTTQKLTGLLISCILSYIGVNISIVEEKMNNLLSYTR